MITVKCTYSNGDALVTSINGTLEMAKDYYEGKWFNIGNVKDDIQQCVKVEKVN